MTPSVSAILGLVGVGIIYGFTYLAFDRAVELGPVALVSPSFPHIWFHDLRHAYATLMLLIWGPAIPRWVGWLAVWC